MEANKKNAVSLAFLTVRKHAVHGYVGGLLVLNHLARPLEFHCTLPVQTTRAQQILYGPTLDEFVCGEQVALALVLKAKSKPKAIFTDTLAALPLRHVHSQPIFAIDRSWEGNNSTLIQPTLERDDLVSTRVEDLTLLVLPDYEKDLAAVKGLFEDEELTLDFLEPFGRIEEALRETHPATKAA